MYCFILIISREPAIKSRVIRSRRYQNNARLKTAEDKDLKRKLNKKTADASAS